MESSIFKVKIHVGRSEFFFIFILALEEINGRKDKKINVLSASQSMRMH